MHEQLEDARCGSAAAWVARSSVRGRWRVPLTGSGQASRWPAASRPAQRRRRRGSGLVRSPSRRPAPATALGPAHHATTESNPASGRDHGQVVHPPAVAIVADHHGGGEFDRIERHRAPPTWRRSERDQNRSPGHSRAESSPLRARGRRRRRDPPRSAHEFAPADFSISSGKTRGTGSATTIESTPATPHD
jgi:hypothetical protein